MTTQKDYKYPASRLRGLKMGSEPIHSEAKTESFGTRLTPTGKQGLEQLALSLGLSKSELLEKLGRGEFELVEKTV